MAYPPPPPPPSPPGPVIIHVQPAPAPKVLTKCSHCGSVYDLALGRCDRCGAPPTETRPEPKSPRKVPRWLYAIVGVVIVAAIVGSVLGYEYQPGNALNPYTERVTQFDWYSSFNGGTPYYLGSSGGCTTHSGHDCWAYYTYTQCSLFCGPISLNSVSVSAESATGQPIQLISSNTPVTIQPGASQGLVVRIGMPNANFDGPVEIVLNFSD